MYRDIISIALFGFTESIRGGIKKVTPGGVCLVSLVFMRLLGITAEIFPLTVSSGWFKIDEAMSKLVWNKFFQHICEQINFI